MDFSQVATGIRTEPSLTIPIYLKYEINGSVEVFGGINYGYYYSTFTETYEPKELKIVNSNSTTIYKHATDTTLNRFSQIEEEYIGCVLRHPSGFEIQTLIDSDLSNIKS